MRSQQQQPQSNQKITTLRRRCVMANPQWSRDRLRPANGGRGGARPIYQAGKRIVPFFEQHFLLRNRFRVGELIGSGGFGQVFRAVDKTTGHCFALKACEAVDDGKRLLIEQQVMVAMNGTRHFPFMIASGSLNVPHFDEPIHYILMELLGPSLTQLRRNCTVNRRFTLGTAIRVGEQCLEALESMHNAGFLHRDVKPSNMCIGLWQWGKHRIVFLIDFGMARKFVQPDGQLRSERQRAAFRGTSRYVSVTVHERKETGRVDDLWSLYYSIIELAEGMLPWRMLQRQKDIEACKKRIRYNDLCRHFPAVFKEFQEHLDKLIWSSTPDYALLQGILRKSWPKDLTEDAAFDWELTKRKFSKNQARRW